MRWIAVLSIAIIGTAAPPLPRYLATAAQRRALDAGTDRDLSLHRFNLAANTCLDEADIKSQATEPPKQGILDPLATP